MDEHMQELCTEQKVIFFDLLEKIEDGLRGVDISHFTDAELRVIKAALCIAAGI